MPGVEVQYSSRRKDLDASKVTRELLRPYKKGALMITYTILGVPYYKYSIITPILIIKAPTVTLSQEPEVETDDARQASIGEVLHASGMCRQDMLW